MKKTHLLYALAIACCSVTFSSCSKVASIVAKATGISWSGIATTVTVPIVTDTATDTSVGSGTFTYNLDSLIKSQTSNLLGLSNIDTVEVTSCVLTIENPDSSNNFANFEQASVSFSTNYNTNTQVAAQIGNNPNNYSATLTVPVNSSINLKSYISPSGATTFNYNVNGKLRAATTKSLTISVELGYYIHVSP